MTFQMKMLKKRGGSQKWIFRCPLDRMRVLNAMCEAYPKSEFRTSEIPDDLPSPRPEDADWVRQVFTTA